MPLPRGTLIGERYRVESVIGEGVQSIVYLAHIVPPPGIAGAHGAPVALKVIHRYLSGDPQIVKRFHREARILSQLEGEQIVKLVDFVVEDGLLVLVLEYVEGATLAAVWNSRTSADPRFALDVALQICAALAVAHATGVIHRDLKPANVLVCAVHTDRTDEARESLIPFQIKVVDFGLGKMLQGDVGVTALTDQGMIFGTPEYMSPEQIRGEDVDARSDLYSLGIMLYEMVVGDVPFKGRSPLATMTAHLIEDLPPPRASNVSLSPTVEALLRRALARDPQGRFASAHAFAEAIRAARVELLRRSNDTTGAPVAFEMSDTDPHVSRVSIGDARTLLPHELRAVAEPAENCPNAPLGRKLGSPPLATRHVWSLIALIAALVGVVIGVIVGAR